MSLISVVMQTLNSFLGFPCCMLSHLAMRGSYLIQLILPGFSLLYMHSLSLHAFFVSHSSESPLFYAWFIIVELLTLPYLTLRPVIV
jgi:hypothetical protein